jgi:hypothetical protein
MERRFLQAVILQLLGSLWPRSDIVLVNSEFHHGLTKDHCHSLWEVLRKFVIGVVDADTGSAQANELQGLMISGIF